jgi:hypothetical protein
VLQSVASLVNLTARRIAKEDERDLEQARVGIDAVRALLPMIPAEAQAQLRNAVSELQVLYAREAGGDGEKDSGGGGEQGQGPGAPPPQAPPRGPGRPPPKLWTPPGA